MEPDVELQSLEGDVCRVCRLEGEADNPLQHPCKCSGSIGYVHSECLTQWLGHSHKKSCELCGHTFSFRKVYPANMPSSLPLPALARRLVLALAHASHLVVRGLIVAVAWLAFLPWVTIAIWRGLFSAGTTAAWWLSGRTYAEAIEVLGANTTVLLPPLDLQAMNVTEADFNLGMLAKLTVELMRDAVTFPWLELAGYMRLEVLGSVGNYFSSDLAADIFKGQLLTVGVIVGCLAAFLLREWILQTLPQVEAGQAAPVPPPPRLDEWQPDMAVRWRRVRVERAQMHPPRPGGMLPRRLLPPPQLDARVIQEEVRRGQAQRLGHGLGQGQGHGQELRRRAPRMRAGAEGAAREGMPPHAAEHAPLAVVPDADEWIDESDDGAYQPDDAGAATAALDPASTANASGSTNARQPHGKTPASSSDSDDILAARPNAEAMREARNRYFTVADHNRDFAALADVVVGESSASGASRAAANAAAAAHGRNGLRAPGPKQGLPKRSARLPGQPVGSIGFEDEQPDLPAPKMARGAEDSTEVNGLRPVDEDAPWQPRRSARLSAKRPEATVEIEPPPSEEDDTQNVPSDGLDAPILPPSGSWIGPFPGGSRADRIGPGPGEIDANEDEETGRHKTDWSSLRAVDEIDRIKREDPRRPMEAIQPPQIVIQPPALPDEAALPEPPGLLGPQTQPYDPEPAVPAVPAAEIIEIVEEDDAEDEVQNGPLPDEDQEDFVDEGGIFMAGDVEAILEAVGFLGPAWVLLQNIGLVLTVLSCCLTVFVEVPYFFGKLQLLGDTDLPLRLLNLPIRAIRAATDPIIDILFEIGRDAIYRPLAPSFRTALASIRNSDATASQSSSVAARMASYMTGENGATLTSIKRFAGAAKASLVVSNPPAWLRLNLVESGLAHLGQAAEKAWQFARHEVWRRFANDTTKIRLISIAIGYTDILASLVVIVVLGEKHLGVFGAAVTEFVDQHFIMLKLGFFMSIELAVFPLIMGAFLDLCCLPLFETASIRSRLALAVMHPILSFFAHWLLGTIFMFAFARCLAICRGICRKGAMYSIRDPQDPAFSPVRDILEKHSATHMWKLTISLAMYLSVLAGPLGCMLLALRWQPVIPQLLPLRWHIGRPISQVPVDYLYLLLAGPTEFNHLNLERALTFGLTKYWHAAASKLRLSSYMRGIRYPEQEQPDLLDKILVPMIQRLERVLLLLRVRKIGFNVFTGGFARVPYADQVALAKGRKVVFVPVDDSGLPLTEEGKIAVLQQVKAAQSKNRDYKKDYCLVYLPSLYTLRFWLFGIGLWTAIAWTVAFAILAPLVVGRLAVGIILDDPVHDGYSLIAGAHLCYAVYLVSRRARKRVQALVRGVTEAARYREHNPPMRQLTEVAAQFVNLARCAYSFLTVVVVVPIAVGLLVDLYVVLPLRYGLSTMTPVFYVAEAWAMGCLLVNLAMAYGPSRQAIVRMTGSASAPDFSSSAELIRRTQDDPILRRAWLYIAFMPKFVDKHYLWPAFRNIAPPLVVPALVTLIVSVTLGLSARATELLFRFIYPSILCVILDYWMIQATLRRWNRWRRRALESEYLIERQVLNYPSGTEDDPGWADMEGDAVDGPRVDEEPIHV